MRRLRLKLIRLLVVVVGIGWVKGDQRQNVSTKARVVRDVDKFPVCVTDSDCDSISDRQGESYKCFQYMCYPWNSPSLAHPFRTCKRRSDCKDLREEEGGDGGNGDCFRHQDRRNVFSGICLSDR